MGVGKNAMENVLAVAKLCCARVGWVCSLDTCVMVLVRVCVGKTRLLGEKQQTSDGPFMVIAGAFG